MTQYQCCLCKSVIRITKYKCCSSNNFFCIACKSKPCPKCKAKNKKNQCKISKCKSCHQSYTQQQMFFDFKYEGFESYFCYKCINGAYQRSSSTQFFYMPFAKSKYDKQDILQYLNNFCELCRVKIKPQVSYQNKDTLRYQCNKCSGGKTNEQKVYCSLCGHTINIQANMEVLLCDSCYNVSVNMEKEVASRSPEKKQKRIIQKEQQMIKKLRLQQNCRQQENSDGNLRENSPKKSPKSNINKTELLKGQNNQPKTEQKQMTQSYINDQILKQNVQVSLRQIDQTLVECTECGYQVHQSMGQKEKGEFKCRGCLVYEKKLKNRSSRYSPSMAKKKVIEEPESRHYTKQKPLRSPEPESTKSKIHLSSLLNNNNYEIPKTSKVMSMIRQEKDHLPKRGEKTENVCQSCKDPIELNKRYCNKCLGINNRGHYGVYPNRVYRY